VAPGTPIGRPPAPMPRRWSPGSRRAGRRPRIGPLPDRETTAKPPRGTTDNRHFRSVARGARDSAHRTGGQGVESRPRRGPEMISGGWGAVGPLGPFFGDRGCRSGYRDQAGDITLPLSRCGYEWKIHVVHRVAARKWVTPTFLRESGQLCLRFAPETHCSPRGHKDLGIQI
jgi:hypothetical protein